MQNCRCVFLSKEQNKLWLRSKTWEWKHEWLGKKNKKCNTALTATCLHSLLKSHVDCLVVKSMQDLKQVKEREDFLCKLHRKDRKGTRKRERERVQSARMCVCIYVCMCVCVFACAHQWPRGMEGIPCSRLRRRKDFGGGEPVPGCLLGVTVKVRRKRRNIHIPYV